VRSGIVKNSFRMGEWLVHPDLNLLSNNGKSVRLEPKVMAVLIHLARHAGEVVTKESLLQAVWTDTFVTDQVLKVSISELRKALGDQARHPRYINTVSKKGYQLIVPVSFEEPEETSEETEETGQRVVQNSGPRKARHYLALGALLLMLSTSVGLWIFRGRERAATRKDAQRIASIAVLPLRNLNGDVSEDFFADGMTETLINNLARAGSLRVISRTSSMQYKGTEKTVPQIARELDVGALVEGSVMREGNRVRVTVRLIEVTSDQPLWGQSYERELKDILDLQSALALDVARQINVKLNSEGESAARLAAEVNPAAYEAYLKGRYFWNKRNAEGFRRSIEYYEQAIAMEPNFALAYAGLADTYTVLGFYSPVRPHESYARAMTAARKALELDANLAETHTSLAGIKHKYEVDWEGAKLGFQRAIELNPNYATAHQWYAIYLQSRGKFDEALAELKRARELDPLSPVIRADRGWILYTARRYDEAIDQLGQALELDPSLEVIYFLVLAYVQRGEYTAAAGLLERAIRQGDQASTYLSLLGFTHAAAGRRKEARQILEVLKGRSGEEAAAPYQFAIIYAALGEKEQALEWLERIYQDRSSWLPFLNVEPELDGLRSEPRFLALLDRIGALH
jgi:TolB-like protein/DNA-binding winged helix-turn-helix (wHTH) protein/Tfp pilus assembly protein PilF